MLRQSGIQNVLYDRFLQVEYQKLRAIQQKQRLNERNQNLLREILGQLTQTFLGISNEIRDYDVKNRDQLQQLVDTIRGNQDKSRGILEEAVKYFQQVEIRRQQRDQQRTEFEKQQCNFQQKQLDQMQQLIGLITTTSTSK